MVLTPTKKSYVIKVLAVAVVITLILSGIYAIVIFEKKEEKKEEKPTEEIDDRISPLTQQAIFLEIHRIRRKGQIIDQIMNDPLGVQLVNKLPIKNLALKKRLDSLVPGFGWDKTPIFNYIVNLDGSELKGRIDYKAWDTGYINYDIYKIIEQWNEYATGYVGEKETAEIEFKFILKDKKLLRTTSNEAESFKIEYDFRTGRWDGDDYFNDSDGYGHFNGSDFEMWFSVYQTDIDGDGIPYWTEVNVLKTDPRMDDSKLDPDMDGIPTDWEWKWGYDPFTWDNHSYLDPDGDGLQNSEEYFMEKWLANPYTPQMYVEVDYIEKTPYRLFDKNLDGWEHIFYEESQQMIMDRYNEHGIDFHVDDGCMGGGGEELPFLKSDYETDDKIFAKGVLNMEDGVISGFYNSHFADERKGIFRYLIVASGGGECFNQNFNGWYDTMTVPTNKNFYRNQLSVLVSTPRIKRIGVAISVLHELGHTLGFGLLYHGGVDNTSAGSDTVWYNYMSCMSYHKYAERLFDYSDGSHGENDKNDWANVDVGYFQKTSGELEGIGFDKHQPPFNA